ncbi:hypothetical protein [Enhygromyxa salina]|uniref:Uncharacterized protein n=1 Tax=Enhygromyxa salina TaxID=215803 RepID=A0A2S9Y6B6_9BACT|nr:hypothetical protein [Enhygromyxa salina]PRQ00596.1 hypothetical protein ENSA7_60910 [Enhygromyxa salina]
MSDPIPKPAWALARSELAQIWVAQVLLVHDQLVWAVIEIRNRGSEQLLVDLTPDDAPQLRLRSASPLVGGIERCFDPERRQTVAKLRASQGVVARRLAPGEC